MRIAQNIAKTVAQRINSRTAQDGGCMVRRYAAGMMGTKKDMVPDWVDIRLVE